jgi:hypothetical protein
LQTSSFVPFCAIGGFVKPPSPSHPPRMLAHRQVGHFKKSCVF